MYIIHSYNYEQIPHYFTWTISTKLIQKSIVQKRMQTSNKNISKMKWQCKKGQKQNRDEHKNPYLIVNY